MTEPNPPQDQAPRSKGAAALAFMSPVLGALLVLAIVGVVWFGVTGGHLGQTAAWNGPIAYPSGLEDPTSHRVTFTDDTVYFTSTAKDGRIWITAVDAETGVEKWSLDEGLYLGEEGADGIEPGQDTILLQGLLSREDEPEYLIDAETGEVHELTPDSDESRYRMVAGMPVRTSSEGDLEVLDTSGEALWKDELDGGLEDNLAAVATVEDLADRPDPDNPIDAEQFASVGHDGTVRVFDKRTGAVTVEQEHAVEPGSDARLVFEDVLYTTSNADTPGRQTITAYDMTDDFAELDRWEGQKGQLFDRLVPCAEKRICVNGSTGSDLYEVGNAVIDLEDGSLWGVPDIVDSPATVMTYAGDTMAIVYYTSWDELGTAEPQTQLYDADFEKIGDPVWGRYTAVDDKTFAMLETVPWNGIQLNINDVDILTLDAEDGGVSLPSPYRAYPGCAIDGAVLACPTKAGYRLWSYR